MISREEAARRVAEIIATRLMHQLRAARGPTFGLVARHFGWKEWVESKGKRGRKPPKSLFSGLCEFCGAGVGATRGTVDGRVACAACLGKALLTPGAAGRVSITTPPEQSDGGMYVMTASARPGDVVAPSDWSTPVKVG